MCGIIGYVGSRECKPLLIQGLERLEYRGYDSAGIALLEEDGLDYVRAVGPLGNLKARAGTNDSSATTGLGHTRWATHGGVTEANAHPLAGCAASKISIVLNGIVENYRELTESLAAEGHAFTSETDAETVTHLIESHYEGDLVEAVRLTSRSSRATSRSSPSTTTTPGCSSACACTAFRSSSGSARTRCSWPRTRPRSCARRAASSSRPTARSSPSRPKARRSGAPTARPSSTSRRELDWDDEGAEKAGFETFMLKEIYEQPEAVAETIGDRVRHGSLVLEGLGMNDEEVRDLRRIVLLAAGTAYHACVVGRYIIEEWARVPVEFDIASEWIYRNPVINEHDLVIGITQSGETRDTITALQLAREAGARTVAITNMMGSQVTREVDSVLYTRAGLEMGVAASKTFTAQVALLYLVALKLAQIRETLPPGEIEFILDFVYKLPTKIQAFLDGDHPIEEIAQRYHDAHFFLYLGRHIGLPVALEGALKLKEISYIPTEAYSAGEMKHGPIALLDEATPVVVVATNIHVYDKIVSNIQEVRARGAHVIAIATDGNEDIQHHADDVIYVPKTPAFLQVVLAILPLQLLAYRIARLRGLNVDQPRNLAKTVTVE